MPAFSPATHKVVTAASSNPKDDLPVDARVMLTRLLSDMGLFQVTPGNTAPSDRDALWWHIDVRQMKRWDAVQGNWFPATPNQIAMHIARRSVLGALADINLETGDLFTFWDVSLGEVKKITRDNLAAALGAIRTIATGEGLKGGGTLAANRSLSLDLPGLTALDTLAEDDQLVVHDQSTSTHKTVTVAQLRSANTGLNFFLGGIQ